MTDAHGLPAQGPPETQPAVSGPTPGSEGNTADSAHVTASAEAQPAEPPAASGNSQLEEFQQELQKAEADPADFNQWVAVEKLVDKLGDILLTRRVYDGLLGEYPLCYGYWKKYADAEHKYTSPEWALNVYERAVAAIPYSPDLWGYYCTYKQKLGRGPDEIRQLFEHGLAYVGTDYLAHGLWDKYLAFETAQGAFANVTSLYLRILASPLKEIDRYFTSFKQYVEQRPASDVMSSEEYASIAASLGAAQGPQPAESAPAESAEVKAEGAPNGDVPMAGEPEVKADASSNGDSLSAKPEGVSEASVKAHWLLGVEALYKGTKEELETRKRFEDAIKRPYFHVKPLDHTQLVAWNSYLDYALDKGDPGTIVRLFERCLVACANYPEFWIRYIRYQEKEDAASSESTVQRAEQVYCKRNAAFQLFAAKYYERHGNVNAAREVYQRVLQQISPGLAEAVVQAASFERRQQSLAAARSIYEDSLAVEELKAGSGDNAAILAMFYAHFLHLDCGDSAAARGVYQKALARATGLRYLWEAAIHFEEYCLEPGRPERVMALYERATSAANDEAAEGLSRSDVEALSASYVDFADRHADPGTAERVAAAHADRFGKYVKPPQEGKKRKSEIVDAGDAKRVATDATAAPAQPDASTAAYTNGYAHSAAATSAAPAGAYAGYQAPAAYSAPLSSAADPAASQAGYYPPASAGYGYGGYYTYPQQYGYAYPGYS